MNRDDNVRGAWMYNPENDIALGYGAANFTAPKNAALLARYAAPVMWWLAGANDEVLVEALEDGVEYARAVEEWRVRMEEFTGEHGAELVSRFTGELECRPWGWSRHAARRFRGVGGKVNLSDEQLDEIRSLSHRRSAMVIGRELLREVNFGKYGVEVPELAVECRSFEEVEGCAKRWDEMFLKTPWSSSGRGVVKIIASELEQYRARIEGIMRHQGSVMAEKAYDKSRDFAMLFRSRHSDVEFVGYSVFVNNPGGAYAGNLLGSDDKLKRQIAVVAGEELLGAIAVALKGILKRMLWDEKSGRMKYEGYLGIDMMTLKGGGIVPFVELNLRCTMGVVAHEVYRRLKGRIEDGECMMLMEYLGGKIPEDEGGIELIPKNPYFRIRLE